MGAMRSTAAPGERNREANGLTWKNSSLNTGAKMRGARGVPIRMGRWEACMSKSGKTLKAVKKAVRKGAPKPTLNGRKADRLRLVAKTVAETKAKVAKVVKKAGVRNGRQANIMLPDGYRPSETEPFMNAHQRIYFRDKLVSWKEEIIRQNRETLQVLHEDSAQHADLADRATSETDRALELRARDRQRKLIAKIDAALARLEDGSYGYCEETGEPIGLKRLDARPIATLSLEAQERHERREKVFRED